jgi:hypothetical protein
MIMEGYDIGFYDYRFLFTLNRVLIRDLYGWVHGCARDVPIRIAHKTTAGGGIDRRALNFEERRGIPIE